MVPTPDCGSPWGFFPSSVGCTYSRVCVSGDSGVSVWLVTGVSVWCCCPLRWLFLSSSAFSVSLAWSSALLGFLSCYYNFWFPGVFCSLDIAFFSVLRSSCDGFLYFSEDFEDLGGGRGGSPCLVSIPSTAAFLSQRAPAPHLQRLSCCLRQHGGLAGCAPSMTVPRGPPPQVIWSRRP